MHHVGAKVEAIENARTWIVFLSVRIKNRKAKYCSAEVWIVFLVADGEIAKTDVFT